MPSQGESVYAMQTHRQVHTHMLLTRAQEHTRSQKCLFLFVSSLPQPFCPFPRKAARP